MSTNPKRSAYPDYPYPMVPMLYGMFPTADGQIAIVGVMEEVLLEMGLSWEEIAALRQSGVI